MVELIEKKIELANNCRFREFFIDAMINLPVSPKSGYLLFLAKDVPVPKLIDEGAVKQYEADCFEKNIIPNSGWNFKYSSVNGYFSSTGYVSKGARPLMYNIFHEVNVSFGDFPLTEEDPRLMEQFTKNVLPWVKMGYVFQHGGFSLTSNILETPPIQLPDDRVSFNKDSGLVMKLGSLPEDKQAFMNNWFDKLKADYS